MDKLRVYWPCPRVEFNGKGIAEGWRDTFTKYFPYELTERWQDADMAFFASDSMIEEEAIGKVPTVAYVWGYWFNRLRDREYHQGAVARVYLASQCDFLAVPSLITYYQLCDFGIPNAKVLVPGVDAELLDQYTHRGVEKRAQVLFLSRIALHKRLGILIEAMSALEPKIPLIVGGSSDAEEYKKMADRLGISASFENFTDEEKVKAIQESAVLVHPSEYEGFGLPPLEALYLGTPTIVQDIPQMRHLLGEFGRYFSTPQDLAARIGEIFNNYNKELEFARYGKAMVEHKYTLKIASQELTELFHEAIREFLGKRMRAHPDEAESIYDRDWRRNWVYRAQYYDPSWVRHWRAQRILQELRKSSAKKIADIGCGAIYPTVFARESFEVSAVDISSECLKQVERVASENNVEVKTFKSRAQSLPFENGTFDAAVLGEILEHVLDPEVVLREAVRIIKPGGIVIATTPVGHHHFDPLHIASSEGGWDDAGIDRLLKSVEAIAEPIVRETIAEEGTEPSCYLVGVRKR